MRAPAYCTPCYRFCISRAIHVFDANCNNTLGDPLSMSRMTITLAQIDTLVGDIPGNTERVIAAARRAVDEHKAAAIIFPELTLTGYPPEDLLLRSSLAPRVGRARAHIRAQKLTIAVVLGYPPVKDGRVHNMAGVSLIGERMAEYPKHNMPNYQAFDEERYFD